MKMLTKMTKTSVATNEVREFVYNQFKIRRMNGQGSIKMIKNLMKHKVNDACAQLNALKQRRCRLRKEVIMLGSYGKRVMSECDKKAKYAKSKQCIKNRKKYKWNSLKQDGNE